MGCSVKPHAWDSRRRMTGGSDRLILAPIDQAARSLRAVRHRLRSPTPDPIDEALGLVVRLVGAWSHVRILNSSFSRPGFQAAQEVLELVATFFPGASESRSSCGCAHDGTR